MNNLLLPFLIMLSILIQSMQFPNSVYGQSGIDAELKKNFFIESVKGWEKYHENVKRLQGKGLDTAFVLSPTKREVLKVSYEFKQANGCVLMMGQGIKVEGASDAKKGEIHVINPKYRFKLIRNKPSSHWAIFEVSHDSYQDPPPNRPDLDTNMAVKGTFLAPISINCNPKEDWFNMVSSPNFHLKGITANKNGDGFVNVDFEMEWFPTKEYPIRVKSGRVWFDPDHLWVMKKCEYKLEWYGGETKTVGFSRNCTKTFYYRYDSNNFPIINKIIYRSIDAKGKPDYEEHYDYNLIFEDVPESAFTLSAFGFPEPNWESPRQTPWYLYAGLGGIVCIVIGLIFRMWANRRTKIYTNNIS